MKKSKQHGGRRKGAGRPPLLPGMKQVKVLLSLSPEIAYELRTQAKREGRTISRHVAELIKQTPRISK